MGIAHISESLVESSKSIASEANSSSPNPNPHVSYTNTSLGVSSLLSPSPDHSPQQPRGPVEMQPIFEYDYEQASSYPVYNPSGSSSEASMEEHAESENQLVSSESSEYTYDGSFDGMMDTHFFYNNNNNNNAVTEAWPAGVGGLSTTFGILPLANNSQYKYPTEQFMIHCHLCGNRLYKGQKDIFIFKGEHAFCSKKCRDVEVGYDDFKEKAARKAQKDSVAKRLENIGKFPVVFGLGPSD